MAFAEPEQEINRVLGAGPIREYHLEGPVEVSVSFYRAGTELFFEGKLKTRTGALCARCAEDFDAASAFAETALNASPGGSIRPFCDATTVTSTCQSS